MLNKEDRVGKRYVNYNTCKQVEYIHKCIDCNTKIYKTAQEEKKSKGYCFECAKNHKHYNIGIYNNINERLCFICKRYLNLNKFPKSHGKNKTTNVGNNCLKCSNLKQFGITSLDYENISDSQYNLCMICKNSEVTFSNKYNKVLELSVDHCHTTGKVRGLLCQKCNQGLGLFKESIQNLREAIIYLESFSKK